VVCKLLQYEEGVGDLLLTTGNFYLPSRLLD